MSFINKIRSLLTNPAPTEQRGYELAKAVSSSVNRLDVENNSMLRIDIITALNGRILQIGKFKPNPHGPDWTYELYLVPDDQSLADAISAVLVMRGL